MFSARARFVIPRLLCVWALLCPAMAGEPPPLIRRAMEFRFMAEPGKVYELQGTADIIAQRHDLAPQCLPGLRCTHIADQEMRLDRRRRREPV